jgi:hypothetical protein
MSGILQCASKWKEEEPRACNIIEIVGAYFPIYYYQWGWVVLSIHQ